VERGFGERVVPVVVAEILRLELPRIEESLNQKYDDGGRATGERKERLIKAVREAYDIARDAIDGYR
jgi:hypothetical protein